MSDYDAPIPLPVIPDPEGSAAARRRRFRALGDAGLVVEMRALDPLAWNEFDQRFRGGLDAYARRFGVDVAERDDLVTETLMNVATRLIALHEPPIANIRGYLVTTLRHRVLALRRAAARRHKRNGLLVTSDGEGVVLALCSEQAVRDSSGVHVAGEYEAGEEQRVVELLMRAILRQLTGEERALLSWTAEGVPHRLIAEWLEIRYDAAAKRVARLMARLRRLAWAEALRLSERDRALIVRRFRGAAQVRSTEGDV